MKVIAHIKTDFTTKFGLPRQSGLVQEVRGKIVFEPEFRVAEAFRGLEEFSHIWLLWEFSMAKRDNWSPTVRPPMLGGNKRMGVFATRSPFRPNSIGLSSVQLEKVEYTKEEGPVLWVRGADLMNDTPIFDIKPYLAYTDSHPEATGGFTAALPERKLELVFDKALQDKVPANKLQGLIGVLQGDPRPSYIDDPDRVYGFNFGGQEIKFKVVDGTLTVLSIE